jgi:hypothetical protein
MTWGGFFYPHQVLVRDLVRAGGMGSSHGAARALAAEVIDTQTLVRDKDGREVVSSTRVTLPPQLIRATPARRSRRRERTRPARPV